MIVTFRQNSRTSHRFVRSTPATARAQRTDTDQALTVTARDLEFTDFKARTPFGRRTNSHMAALTPTSIYSRGHNLARAHKFRSLTVTARSLSGQVRSSDYGWYQVTVTFPATTPHQPTASCTCPYAAGGSWCKHEIAVCKIGVALIEQGGAAADVLYRSNTHAPAVMAADISSEERNELIGALQFNDAQALRRLEHIVRTWPGTSLLEEVKWTEAGNAVRIRLEGS